MNSSSIANMKKDRLRYSKNTLSSSLTILSIVFNALYFIIIYKSDVGSFYYTYLIGISIVYNLLFMLISFLASEGVKNYNINYSYALIVLGIGQIIRIFILPTSAHSSVITLSSESQQVMSDGQFFTVCVFLIGSAAFSIMAGITAFVKTKTLRSYEAEIEEITRGETNE